MKKMNEECFDFLLSEYSFQNIRFRFYPKESHLVEKERHSLNDKDNVKYTVYSWAIMISKNRGREEGKEDWTMPKALFEVKKDRASFLPYLPDAVRSLAKKKAGVIKLARVNPTWEIQYLKKESGEMQKLVHKDDEEDRMRFVVWDADSDTGYRFELDVDKAIKFADFVDEFN